MKEVPDINLKSVQINQKRKMQDSRNGSLSKPVHQRLYSHVMTKDELAAKTNAEIIEEATRKTEYLKQNFEDHRISVS